MNLRKCKEKVWDDENARSMDVFRSSIVYFYNYKRATTSENIEKIYSAC